ncbi:MAG: hypothetical protein RRY99_17595, partial [Flavobacterium sp.]
MKEEPLKYKGKFEKLWTDPVWSKIISATIIAIVTILYSIVQTAFENVSIYDAYLKVMNFKIEVYIYLVFSIISIGIYFLINFIRKKINKKH